MMGGEKDGERNPLSFNLTYVDEYINNASSFNDSLNLTKGINGSFSTIQCDVVNLSWN